MAQYIKNANIFGRLGTGIGEGLAEQIPKEIEHNRLKSDLAQFEKDYQNLTPTQQVARAGSIRGATPQLIHSLTEMAKIQNRGNAYRNAQNQYGQGSILQQNKSSPDLRDAEFSQMMQKAKDQNIFPGQNQQQQSVQQQQQQNQARTQQPTYANEPAIVNQPELNPNALPKGRWPRNKKIERVNEYQNQGFLIDEAKQLADEDEANDLAGPGILEEQSKMLQGKREQARGELKRQLETKLQKEGENVYKDVTGEMLINAERGMERDLRTHPGLTFQDAAHEWSNRLNNVAKAKDQLRKLAATSGKEAFFQGDKVLKKLGAYQDIFKKSGNSQEYYNLLRSEFGLSPQGAATVALPITKGVKKYIENFKPNHKVSGNFGPILDETRIDSNSRKAAIEIEKFLDSDDSLLSIARALSEKDPYFNQRSFFDQLNEDQGEIRLNDRQKLELAEGEKDILPNWADLKYFPWFRSSTK